MKFSFQKNLFQTHAYKPIQYTKNPNISNPILTLNIHPVKQRSDRFQTRRKSVSPKRPPSGMGPGVLREQRQLTLHKSQILNIGQGKDTVNYNRVAYSLIKDVSPVYEQCPSQFRDPLSSANLWPTGEKRLNLHESTDWSGAGSEKIHC